ncbi:hypothetical protein [Paenarthrobacter sp. NPDC058040]|uniref:hypothetical protein n=1 Tax=unclassified Paenarthrobacter TaxID=2634190 RepID=UPI0036D9046E
MNVPRTQLKENAVDDSVLEARFLDAMSKVAMKVLQPEGPRTYDIMIDNANQFITDFLDSNHGGAAYAIWMEVSDYLDHPTGPMTEQACDQAGCEVATEWLPVDQSSPEATGGFFTRWRSPEPWPA